MALKGVTTTYEICKGIYNIVDGMKKAPAEIERVLTEIQGFYCILGANTRSRRVDSICFEARRFSNWRI